MAAEQPPAKFKVGLVQMAMSADPDANLRRAVAQVAEAKAAGAQYKENFEKTTDPLISKVRGFADEVAGVGSRIGETMYRKWGPRRDGDGDGDGQGEGSEN